MKKYKLIKDKNSELKRVVALISIPTYVVNKGDIGGLVESENNLSHNGNAWVSGNAWVYGDALVSGNARVSGYARVSGDAWNKSPLYIQGSLYALTNCKYGYVRVGCEEHSIKEWIKDGKKIAEKHGFTKEQIAEYAEYIKLFEKIGK